MNKIIFFQKKIKLFILLIIALPVLFISLAWAENETPAKIFTGMSTTRETLRNIEFNDIVSMPSDYWAKDAIYEIAAIGTIKGYGDNNFHPERSLSKEECIALIYRMLGKEDEAQQAAEVLDSTKSINQKKTQAVALWADGYLQLAANDGLITQANLQTALQRFQPKSGTKRRFVRADPAERQEVAQWVAKAISLEPIYEQQVIFNSFNDWDSSDPLKIPYIEAILQNKIMNGKPGGYFDPEGNVRRDHMAQILKNMENLVLALRSWDKKSGYIEAIYQNKDVKQTGGVLSKVLMVRGDDGKLYHIMTETYLDELTKNKQEFEPGIEVNFEKELIVYKNGELGTSQSLNTKDRLEFIVDDLDRVRFVKAEDGSIEEETIEGTIVGINQANNTVSIMDTNGNITIYGLKTNAEILNNDKLVTITDIKENRWANFLIQNDLIARLEVKLASPGREKEGISGLVEDNNPSLRYISLYDKDGFADSERFRIYNYNPDVIEVQRNGKEAQINDIQPGDTVHIILGENGSVEKISGADNYEVVYGKILFKNQTSLGIEYNNGVQQVISVADDIIVINDHKIWYYEELQDGEYVRLLLQKTPSITEIKQITTQTYAQNISNVYKAELSEIDIASQSITVKHPEKMQKGEWERYSQIGFMKLKVDNDIRIFNKGIKTNLEQAKQLYIGRNAYIAVQKGFGNKEIIKAITFINQDAKELLHKGTLSYVEAGINQIKLTDITNTTVYNQGTIVIKDGKLINGTSLCLNDTVYMVADEMENFQPLEANVIITDNNPAVNPIQIFRGEIEDINTNKDFTLKTFSILDDLEWEYKGYAKTFSINYDTRIVGEEGVINVRQFTPYSDQSYIGKIVYVVADETQAIIISTAPYGAFNVRGEVLECTQNDNVENSEGSIKLIDASIYDMDSGEWEYEGILELDTLTNTAILKNNQTINLNDIEKGDLVRILKKDDTTTGDAYLILIEG